MDSYWWGRMAAPLRGVWRTEPDDETSLAQFGDVTLEFRDDGSLLYIMHDASKDQIISMTYRVLDDSWLETNQPSAPRVEHTRYSVTNDRLVLDFGGTTSRYVRV